jgi:hypothetical protein
MPIHDWSRVEAGIFHDFHHAWIEQIKRALNEGILPPDHYALAEQHAAGFGPDVLTLRGGPEGDDETRPRATPKDGGGLQVAPPKSRFLAETECDYYRRKQSTVTVRHVSGDAIVAMIEVVSPGNKSSRSALGKFVAKAAELFVREIHLLVLDLLPPGPRDPHGIHAAIWEEFAGEEFVPPSDKPLTLVSYEADLAIRAYIEPVAVGDVLPDMPLFLMPRRHVSVPLEATYQSAWEAVPRRWRAVIEG